MTNSANLTNKFCLCSYSSFYAMPSQSLSYDQPPLERTEKNHSFPIFDLLLYAAASVGAVILLFELYSLWTLPIAVTSAIVFGVIGYIFTRQIRTLKERMALMNEKAVQKSDVRFQALIENSSDLITIRDHQGNLRFRSSSVKTILGYEPEEYENRASYDLIHSEDLERIKEASVRLNKGEIEKFQIEYRCRHKNGAWRILEGVAKKYDDDLLDLHGVIVSSRDVTDRKIAENQLRTFTARLEQSNRELQDFAYVASHDLQEPLRKVQAFGDRLNKKYADKLGDEGLDYVRRMRDAADRMQTLINDLLTFSRITTKAQPFVRTDLTRIAKEVISDLEIKIEETGAVVEIADLPTLDADPLQMRQLLQNLIGNALKFSRPAVAPHIKIYPFESEEDIHKTQAAGDFFEFAVKDNGIGFDEKYLDRIFTVFQRLHGRTEYEGSGVGLAVCRKIVERHGGKITAKSQPEKGAVFIISIPVKQFQGEMFND